MTIQFYIDPGTGSMLFTILIAVFGSLVYLLRGLKLKVGSLIGRDRKAGQAGDRTPVVIFSDSRRYWNTFGPVCRELDRRGIRTQYLTQSPDDPALKESFQHVQCEYIGEGNRAYARLNFLSAGIVLSTTPGLEVYQWKRSKDVSLYVHIPHAASDITLYRMFGLDYYDAVLLSGDYQIRQVRELEKVRGLPAKDLELAGIPYMDSLRERLLSSPSAGEGQRTILLAPSWGKSAMLAKYGEDIIRAVLATGYHVIIRPHPQSFTSEKDMIDRLMAAFPANDQLEWNRDNDNFSVLARSSIMISDFSGVMFDYSLVFDRPLLYADTSFDSAPYDCCWLDEPLWTFRVLPTLGRQITPESLPRLKEIVDDCLENESFREAREKARQETWAHMGEGAVRIADYLEKRLNMMAQSEAS